MKLAVVGVTGMVGREIIEVLSESILPIKEFIPVASAKSCGRSVFFKKQKYIIISLKELLEKDVDVALFSAGSNISKIWSPKLAAKGCRVVDNSSYWRMHQKHKLIIPEINGNQLTKKDLIISNPNCSTIQLLMVLAPLHERFVVKRVVVSTYQAVSGTGKKAVEQLEKEERNVDAEMVYPHQIYRNAIPHCDNFMQNGYTKEEMKLTNETKKILDKKINVVATAVRIPVFRGHSESVNISFANDFKTEEIIHVLNQASGVKVLDNPQQKKYPTAIDVHKKNDVFVGRIRKDFTQEKTLNLWIVSDNLRKGAATNTVQIAERLFNKKII